MKICFTSTGKELDALLDFRFARAAFFLILDQEGNPLKAIKNNGVQAAHGAGPLAARLLMDENIDVLITGNVGPNALAALTVSGIKIFIADSNMSVKEAFLAYKRGELREIDSSRGNSFARGGFFNGPGQGRGQGRGRGRGQGFGRGRNSI